MQKSNLMFLLEALEMGIPHIHENRIWRLFYENNKHVLKFGYSNSSGETGYMGDFPLGYLDSMANALTEADRINIAWIKTSMSMKKEDPTRSFKNEDFVFEYEEEFFKNM